MVPVTAGSEQLTRAMQSLEATFLIGVEGVTEIWLVRHADCYQRMTDSIDPPLSELGRDQEARAEAAELKRINPQFAYKDVNKDAARNARYEHDLRKAGLQ